MAGHYRRLRIRLPCRPPCLPRRRGGHGPLPLPKRRLARADVARLEEEADQQDSRRPAAAARGGHQPPGRSLPRPGQGCHRREFWDGSAAVDATPIRTFSRGVSAKDAKTATDPDAAWYVREGNHRDPAADPQEYSPTTARRPARPSATSAGSKPPWSSPVRPPPRRSAAARGHPRHQPPPSRARSRLHRPQTRTRPAGNAITALKDMRRRNYPTGWLAADRAYNAALPETFHIPVRDLGYRPIWDYRIDQLEHPGQPRRRPPHRRHLVLPQPPPAP